MWGQNPVQGAQQTGNTSTPVRQGQGTLPGVDGVKNYDLSTKSFASTDIRN